MLARLIRGVDLVIDLAAAVGAIGLLVALGVTVADVVCRAFGAPIYGSRDIVSMAGVFVVFGGLAYAHKTGAHIVVDLLERKFPPGLNRWLTVAGHGLFAFVMALVVWQLWLAVDLARMLRMSTNLLYLPRWPFLIAMALLALIAMASMVLRGLQAALERPKA